MPETASPTYKWNRASCAPVDRPAHILEAVFFDPANKAYPLLNSELLHNGWGETGLTSLGIGGPQPLPFCLLITWYSLAEDRFYSGRLELPAPRLQQLFETGFRHPATGKQATWDTLLLGVAPGGRVVLWVTGGGLTVEVCRVLAPEAKISWESVPASVTGPQASWRAQGLARALDEPAQKRFAIEGPNPERWDLYRVLHPWRPLLLGAAKAAPAALFLNEYNGEREHLTELGSTTPPKPRPLPSKFILRYTGADATRHAAHVQFNEQEIFQAFGKLPNRDHLDLHLDVTDGLKLYLCDAQYSLELLAADVKVYAAE